VGSQSGLALPARTALRSVAVASAGNLRIIDSTSGITRHSFSLAGTAKVAALSPEGDFLVAATDAAEVHVWQSEPPKEIADFKLPDRSAITRLAVSPGATNVIAIPSGKITRSGVPVQAHVWQSPFTTEVAAFSGGHDRSGFQTDVCALSADGWYLAAGVQSFGCRPTTMRQPLWGRRPKASREGTRGGRGGGRRLWRFDGGAACASDATVDGGERRQPTAAVGVKALPISGGRDWCRGRRSTSVQRP